MTRILHNTIIHRWPIFIMRRADSLPLVLDWASLQQACPEIPNTRMLAVMPEHPPIILLSDTTIGIYPTR
ncbi:hypothetical protein [Ralstonia phage RP13]|nr:hypothetical protein [Ralstonia phage RP13]